MRALTAVTTTIVLALAFPLAASACESPDRALGVERIVEIDASAGPLFGALTKQEYEPTFLGEKEVVLTFDDGPSPWVTPQVLDALERHCTKATFFAVGKMAVSYPAIAIDIIARGHTLGGHTWSHPRQLPKMASAKAEDEIERGFAALEAATAGGIAPFFRFTGLNDSGPLLTYLQNRGIATFTVDVVSDDSFIASPEELARVTLQRTAARGRGILLFHDIKPATAMALPAILDGLKAQGFKIVHLRHKVPLESKSSLVGEYREKVAEKLAGSRTVPRLMPFYGAIAEIRDTTGTAEGRASSSVPVTQIAPEARDRAAKRMVVREPPKQKSKPAPTPSPRRKPQDEPGVPSPGEEILPWKTGATVPPVSTGSIVRNGETGSPPRGAPDNRRGPDIGTAFPPSPYVR